MAFDKPTRNLLANFVSDARGLLTEEFTRQMQAIYGMNPETGEVAPLEALTALTNFQRATAQILRDTLAYYLASAPKADARARRDALDRIVREQAFTVLNRLAAVRMAEARGLIIESIAKGYQSEGFRLYDRLAGPALGGTGDAYRAYLFSLFDEFAVDLPVLFDRFSPEGRLFPREKALLALLDKMNAPEIAPLWAEDETIGWIYQYFNSKSLRDRLKRESKIPRNSYEISVRSSYYTPKFIVSFLTDNTLGRIWYEMTRGETGLAASCRYLVRRPLEIFLNPISLEEVLPPDPQRDERESESAWWMTLPEEPTWPLFARVAEALPGPRVTSQLLGEDAADVDAWLDEARERYGQTGRWEGDSARLWLLMWAWTRRLQARGQAPDVHAWAEMQALYHAWQEALAREAEETDQETLLHQPVYIPHRGLKDPRDILMLDPACGSMHFGLYAFDLYEQMYREAWDLEARLGPNALARPEDLRPLHETFADQETFLKAIPKLIVERNIHGIDIDPRAVQIAGLSLWLRAQRSWHEMGVKALDRPLITKSNIVCAEPMPGDEALLEEFIANLENPVLGDLMRTIVDKMKLAGEAGSLLKIEKEISRAVEEARVRYEDMILEQKRQKDFLPGFAPENVSNTLLDFAELPDMTHFWEHAEKLLLDALKFYAEQAENGSSYRRRLFAHDTAQGFAFIELLQRTYAVVVMNPPYSETQGNLQEYLKNNYPNNWTNLYSAFIERSMELSYFRTGFICLEGLLSAHRMKNLRQDFIETQKLDVFSTLPRDTFEDMGLSTAVFVLSIISTFANPLFIKLTEKGISSPFAISKSRITKRTNFILTPDIIGNNSKIWQSQPLSPNYATVVKGNTTFYDLRFVRTWWEVYPNDIGKLWHFWQKGGEYQPFILSTPYVMKWDLLNEGKEIRYHGIKKVGTDAQVIQSSKFWWKSGLIGPAMNTTGAGFNVRVLPSGQIFSAKSTAIFPKKDEYTFVLLGLLNSRHLRWYLYQQGAGLSGNTGKLKNLPIIWPENDISLEIEVNTKEIIDIMAQLESTNETSSLFVHPFRDILELASQYKSLIRKIDNIVHQLYGDDVPDEIQPGIELAEAAITQATNGLINSKGKVYFSYFIGVLFGRWDIRLTINNFTVNNKSTMLQDPFAPLPSCSPGMLTDELGLAATVETIPMEYPIDIAWSGILVNDPSKREDIIRRMRELFQMVWQKNAETLEIELCKSLGVDSVEDYLSNPNLFFDDHLKSYSKSRRYAPIYWPLSTPSGSYTLWLYYHRLNDQILYTAVNDFVEPKLKEVSREVRHLRGVSHRTREQEKDLERLTDLEMELIEFKEELLRIAAFWKPNLNDGVQITAAPLWKLFRHRQWRQRLQETWEKLEAGEYDWAHLAMSIWPERVVPKCRQDRSLAIAHDLDDLFWVEEEGRGRLLQAPAEEIARQRQRQRTPVREEVRAELEALASGRARGLSARAVWEKLEAGEWDDTLLALRLWPERVAKKVWADRNLAQKLKVAIPEKRRKNPTRKFIKELEDKGEPALAELLARALAEEDAPFQQVWTELAAGQRDDQPLALALWPDRVIDKCLEDVQLAQAHGLAPYFWTKHPAGVWRRRKTPDEEIRDEIKRRKKQ